LDGENTTSSSTSSDDDLPISEVKRSWKKEALLKTKDNPGNKQIPIVDKVPSKSAISRNFVNDDDNKTSSVTIKAVRKAKVQRKGILDINGKPSQDLVSKAKLKKRCKKTIGQSKKKVVGKISAKCAQKAVEVTEESIDSGSVTNESPDLCIKADQSTETSLVTKGLLGTDMKGEHMNKLGEVRKRRKQVRKLSGKRQRRETKRRARKRRTHKRVKHVEVPLIVGGGTQEISKTSVKGKTVLVNQAGSVTGVSSSATGGTILAPSKVKHAIKKQGQCSKVGQRKRRSRVKAVSTSKSGVGESKEKEKITVTPYQRKNLDRVYAFALQNGYNDENWKNVARDSRRIRRVKIDEYVENDTRRRLSGGLNLVRMKFFNLARVSLRKSDKVKVKRLKRKRAKMLKSKTLHVKTSEKVACWSSQQATSQSLSNKSKLMSPLVDRKRENACFIIDISDNDNDLSDSSITMADLNEEAQNQVLEKFVKLFGA